MLFSFLFAASAAMGVAPGHESWMLHALRLAERGRLSTPPNPWVGCVIVAEDGQTVLAEGYHRQKGARDGQMAPRTQQLFVPSYPGALHFS